MAEGGGFSTFLWGLFLMGVAFIVLLYLYQESLLYIPTVPGLQRDPDTNPAPYRSPKDQRLEYEDVWVKTPDGEKLHAWWVPYHTSKEVPTLLFLHANAGNMGIRIPNTAQMLQKLHVNVFMLEYRGYGKSTGTPSERGLKTDGQAALDYLVTRTDLDPKRIILFGRSLGGAVAINTAHNNMDKLCACIIENSFTSISDMVDHMFGFLRFFKALVLRMEWRSVDLIPKITTPILFLSSAEDEIVPPVHMQRLFERADKSLFKEMKVYARATHNDLFMVGGDAYYEDMRNFIEKVARPHK